MVQTLIASIIAGIAGLWIASRTFPGTRLEDPLTLLIAGATLGVVITIIKPFANFIVISLLFAIGITLTIFFLR
ncbi:MAG: hypothetical protein A2842_00335 [Candidatus Wildermuthbacteria bacterium RIFCSPHIGHO2_01_FULL_48_25]|uniref:Uncharacterized protein n=1 Tax=Candidatus Wildermuthbacteria bacterium RIFCSPLOWO2_01_FULL_48_16 TaxID=1802461 RepID=A0A1G2RLW0_9BACT|nr:MAG: hypothetical protein A2842_00335 [Candidatus Wildermuthbacteria bacterium RIFCSPHIGHO2_01_FULL_48_25]OHA68718.1 MAG: hypothetical protein A3J57_00720 [Candidatus Wildermuthbacteria bacterium RIFCSPHIGHO2_02_FULL_49_12b]OHA73359.1 MAG: hypothetical protein A3B24_00430 [Candidatus Wildermuthbacteria bacterium RIFCSPLOWO2_01_FULL_48_16]